MKKDDPSVKFGSYRSANQCRFTGMDRPVDGNEDRLDLRCRDHLSLSFPSWQQRPAPTTIHHELPLSFHPVAIRLEPRLR
jgi:hypothetical protein